MPRCRARGLFKGVGPVTSSLFHTPEETRQGTISPQTQSPNLAFLN